jgi:hyaluronan synthase
MRVVVSVPVYNEDPAALQRGLLSLLQQTRLPDVIHVVDDGSTSGSYDEVRHWFSVAADNAGVEWQVEPSVQRGKRTAQARVFQENPDADIFLTVDSDGWLDAHAVEEGMKPFAGPAGYLGGRGGRGLEQPGHPDQPITDLYFVTNQLTDRSSASCVGSVVVNSGPLALYRAGVVGGTWTPTFTRPSSDVGCSSAMTRC